MTSLIFSTEPFWCQEQDESGWNQQTWGMVTTGRTRKRWCVQGSIALCMAMAILPIRRLGSQARALGKAELFLQGIKQRCSPQLPCTCTATAPCSIALLWWPVHSWNTQGCAVQSAVTLPDLQRWNCNRNAMKKCLDCGVSAVWWLHIIRLRK